MLWSRKRARFDNGGCYAEALQNIDLWMPYTDEDKIRYYSFVVDRLKIAIAADSHLDFILRSDLDDNTKSWIYFPAYRYTDSLHCECIETGEKIKLDLSKDLLAASTSKGGSIVNHLKARLGNDYKQRSNHRAKYYSYIDFGVVYNGIHSTASAMYYKEGKIEADLCDFPQLFSSTATNGVEWQSITANKNMGLVRDYRYAVLFEIAKRRFSIDGHNYNISAYQNR